MKKTAKNTQFTPFYFEGNRFNGYWVNNEEDLKRLLNAYKVVEGEPDIKGAQLYNGCDEKTKEQGNNFGFYTEYSGEQTLGEWLSKYMLDLIKKIEKDLAKVPSPS